MPNPGTLRTAASDAELVGGAVAGGERAMAALYDRYGAMLHAAYRIVGQRANAEEVVEAAPNSLRCQP